MLNLRDCKGFKTHRFGWGYVINSLRALHSSGGIYFNDFIERSFSWEYDRYFSDNPYDLPYSRPWIGVFHNPPNHPTWFDYHNSVDSIISRPVFQESIKSCRGIFTLSKYLGDYLSKKIDVPIFPLYHPTELNVDKWNIYKFLGAPTVLQVGYWLRVMNAITEVSKPGYAAEWSPSDYDYALIKSMSEDDLDGSHWVDRVRKWEHVKRHKFMDGPEYDKKLESSVILCKLYDSSANNTIIECIAKETPIIVNKLPAVVEYLGEDYPLYLDGPINSMLDTDRIYEAHRYLSNLDKTFLHKSTFFNGVCECVEKLR